MGLTTAQTLAIKKQSDAYAKAKASGDRTAMMNANAEANAIRTSAGVATQYSNAELTKYATPTYKAPEVIPIEPIPVQPIPVQPIAQNNYDYAGDISKAYLAKQKAMQDGLNTQLGQIDQASDDNRSKVYTNSRLSAIGNNEQLASRGLAGGLYGDPTSGKSESSRISQDVALGNDINAINRQQTDLESQARNIVSSGIADNQLEMAKVIAEMKASKATADRADFDNTIGAYSSDYQAQINKLKAQGYSDDSYEVKSLNSARNNKKAGIATAQAESQQQAFENQIKLMNASKSSGSGGGYSGLSASQAQTAYNNGVRTPEVMSAMSYHFGVTTSKAELEKPVLSASEAKKAFDEGGDSSKTKNVKYAMMYYYDQSDSEDFNELTKKMANMTEAGKVSWIEYYVNNKKIDETEAKYLLTKNGLM